MRLKLQPVFATIMKRLCAVIVSCVSIVAAAVADEINQVDGVAILGYDTVGYFTQHKPVPGDKAYVYSWRGSEWHFADTHGRELFIKDPQAYAPQFGGYCANGLSQGHKIEANPEIWLIRDGKLYMFFSEAGRQRWINTDYKRRIKEATQTWQQLQHE